MGVLIKCFLWILFMVVYSCSLIPVNGEVKGNGPSRGRAVSIRNRRLLDILHGKETRVKRQWSATGRGVGDHGSTYQLDETNSDTYNRLLQHIQDQIDKGHLTNDTILHWFQEIQNRRQHGQLTSTESVKLINVLIAAMKAITNTTPIIDNCCPFG